MDRLARELQALRPALPAWAANEGARLALAVARERVLKPEDLVSALDFESLLVRAGELAQACCEARPRRVVNATGVVLHTNLGRAPLARSAAAAVAVAASGYGDLELDLASGRRGRRLGSLEDKLMRLSGAEAALAVNNNAAAVLLALDSLGRGREVVVSRGELVEIGGSFRVPEIMARAGVRLVEVGATNRTHLRDYAEAVGPETALLLKVHRSNFEQRGFVSEVGLAELAGLARERGLPLVEDLGSGSLLELPGLPPEAFAPRSLRLGADLVCFSGDKLLGGPQAGIVLGRAEPVAALRANPLARALRLDKLSLAGLDATLGLLLAGRAGEIPAVAMLQAPSEQLESRARALAGQLEKLLAGAADCRACPLEGVVGGGSVPGHALAGWGVAISAPAGAERLAAGLREAPLPVLARVQEGQLLLDVRTLLDGDEAAIAQALVFALDASR